MLLFLLLLYQYKAKLLPRFKKKRSLLAPSSSSLHHTLELSLWPDTAETERDYLNQAPNEITDEEFLWTGDTSIELMKRQAPDG